MTDLGVFLLILFGFWGLAYIWVFFGGVVVVGLCGGFEVKVLVRFNFSPCNPLSF